MKNSLVRQMTFSGNVGIVEEHVDIVMEQEVEQEPTTFDFSHSDQGNLAGRHSLNYPLSFLSRYLERLVRSLVNLVKVVLKTP